MPLINDGPEQPAPGKTSIRLGSAFLRPAEERDHFELMRQVVTVRNDGDRLVKEEHGRPIGPLAVYRIKRKGDKMLTMADMAQDGPPLEMRTSHPHTREPIELTLVWWPGMEPRSVEPTE